MCVITSHYLLALEVLNDDQRVLDLWNLALQRGLALAERHLHQLELTADNQSYEFTKGLFSPVILLHLLQSFICRSLLANEILNIFLKKD